MLQGAIHRLNYTLFIQIIFLEQKTVIILAEKQKRDSNVRRVSTGATVSSIHY
jgi:hypothetical protein